MKLIKMDITLIAIIATGLMSTGLAVYSKLEADKKEKKAEEDVLDIQKTLTQESISLSNLLLMEDYVSSTVRIVFQFKKPINVLLEAADTSSEKFKDPTAPPTPSLHVSKFANNEGIFNIYTAATYPQQMSYLSISANVGTLGKYETSMSKGFPGLSTFVYYEDGLQNAAIEIPNVTVNLARFYSQIKQPNNYVTLRKNYPPEMNAKDVIAEENRFLAQNPSVSFEVPLIEEKGIWFKVNLVPANPKKPYQLLDGGGYCCTIYKWVVEKNNNGFIFNKIDGVYN